MRRPSNDRWNRMRDDGSSEMIEVPVFCDGEEIGLNWYGVNLGAL